MAKTVLVTPLYVSVAWILMVSYQLFTQTAVTTVLAYVNLFLPTLGGWVATKIDLIVFIYAFAWIFVLSSVIPAIILGKERSVLIQFLVCLILAFVAYWIGDTLAPQTTGFATLFLNPVIALTYLLIPYILMIILDIRSRRKYK